MVESVVETKMFSFSSRLFFHKHAISKKTGEVSIYLYVYISVPGRYEDDNFPLKLRWPADKVDCKASVLLPRFRDDPDVNDYNMIIMSERAKYNDIAKRYRLSNQALTIKLFRRALKFADPTKSVVRYIELASRERFKDGDISVETKESAGTLINLLTDYKEFISFSELDTKWMNGFKIHLQSKNIAAQDKPPRYRKPGTIWRRMKDLKAYLKLASDDPQIYVSEEAVEFPNPPPEEETIFLNRDELRRMMIVLRSGRLTEVQRNVLKAFLFTCFTSLRISDLYRSNSEWLVTDDLLVFTQWKNRRKSPTTVHIPLNAMAKSLVDDTAKTFFELPSEQEYNRTLKELAIKAEIRKNLKSHVGRHTFGYLYMTTSGNLYGLKKIMGHKKIATTERYAHLDEEYNMAQVMKLQEGFEDVAGRGTIRRIS